MRRLSVTAVMLAMACASGVTTKVDVADKSAVFFFVAYDGDNRITRVTPVVGVRDGAVAFGERPQLRLLDGETSVVQVAFTEDALRLIAPGYDATRSTSISVRNEAPPEIPARMVGASLTAGSVATRLPASTTFNALTPDGTNDGERVVLDTTDTRVGVAFARLTVEAPVDFEHCKNPVAESLKPYGARARILEDAFPNSIRKIIGVGWIDADTVLVLTNRLVVVVERGRQATAPRLDPNGANVWLPVEMVFPPDRVGRFSSVAVDPGASADGSRRVLITGAYEPPTMRDDDVGYLIELAYREDGLTRVRTATAVPDAEAREVSFDDEGRFAAMFDLGHVVLGERDSDALVFAPFPPVTGPSDVGRRLIHTKDAARPWLAGTRGRLHFFDRQRSAWDTTMLTSSLQDSLHFTGLGASPTGAYWASSARGIFYQFVNQTWEAFELIMPPRHRPCSPGGDPTAPALGEPMETFTMGLDYGYAALEGCTHLLEIRVADACVSVRAVEGESSRLLDDYIDYLNVFDGELFAGAEDGVLLSMRVDPR